MLKKHVIRLLWVALCAACINALVPTLSYLVATERGLRSVELCSSFGVKTILVAEDADPASTPAHQDINPHCLFCLASQDAAAFLRPDLMQGDTTRRTTQVTVEPPRPAYLHPWRTGRPRAPPFILSA